MIIEFIGTPGSGKTTLMPTVIEHFNSRGFKAYSVLDAARPFSKRTFAGKVIDLLSPPRLQRALHWQTFYHLNKLYRIKFFARNWKLVSSVWSFQRGRPITGEDRHHVLFWFFHLVGRYEFLKSHALLDEVLVFDEGFVHRVVQLFASDVEEVAPAQVIAYLDLLPQPDVVIYLSAPHDICEKRVHARGIWERFSQKTSGQFSRYIANSSALVHIAVDHIQSRGWTVLEIDNGGEDPAKSALELRRALSSLSLSPVGLPQLQPSI